MWVDSSRLDDPRLGRGNELERSGTTPPAGVKDKEKKCPSAWSSWTFVKTIVSIPEKLNILFSVMNSALQGTRKDEREAEQSERRLHPCHQTTLPQWPRQNTAVLTRLASGRRVLNDKMKPRKAIGRRRQGAGRQTPLLSLLRR